MTLEGRNHIKLEFLGKDSIKYENTVEVHPKVRNRARNPVCCRAAIERRRSSLAGLALRQWRGRACCRSGPPRGRAEPGPRPGATAAAQEAFPAERLTCLRTSAWLVGLGAVGSLSQTLARLDAIAGVRVHRAIHEGGGARQA